MYTQRSGNKYRAKSTMVDGIVFHSKLEAAYYSELKIRKLGRDIKDFERQVKLDIKVNGVHICNYYIDFIILHNDGSREFVETKGLEMKDWKLKWALLEATFDDFRQHADDRMTVVKQSSMRFR